MDLFTNHSKPCSIDQKHSHCLAKLDCTVSAVIAMENFLRNMRREEVSIDQQINNLLQQQINKNREILKSLFKIRIFCGITTQPSEVDEIDDEPQNACLSDDFQALSAYRIDSRDETLQHYLESGTRILTFISKTIQNEMITTVVAIILNNLSMQIRDSKQFLLSSDISNKENLSVVVRFLDCTKSVREEFVGFYFCEHGTTVAFPLPQASKTAITIQTAHSTGECY